MGPTYYEILKVQPIASVSEIEAAYEAQYNQWRRLVTHHDPSVVNQANQALDMLQRIRVTLTDIAKRAGYDEAIGISGPIGGLADPEVLSRTLTPPSPIPRKRSDTLAQSPATSEQRVDAWTCPRCHTANLVRTRFCKNCGQSLGRTCPNCDQLIEVAAKFCTECGADDRVALRIDGRHPRNPLCSR